MALLKLKAPSILILLFQFRKFPSFYFNMFGKFNQPMISFINGPVFQFSLTDFDA